MLQFIIPTKDRESQLCNLLRSLERQNIEGLQVIIVDGGKLTVKNALGNFKKLKIHYIKVDRPSLTKQRNIGISSLDDKIGLIGFLDDDTELLDGALRNMLNFWDEASAAIGGACFNVINYQKSRFYWIKRLFFTGNNKMGRVLASGFPTQIWPTEKNTFTQWLLGGVTVWRKKVLDEFKFDEWFKGYGHFEDLEFSYRVGKKYKLVVVADAKIKHLQPPFSEKKNFQFAKTGILGLHHLVMKNRELSILLFFWACLGQFLEDLLMFLIKRKNGFLKSALGVLSGVLEVSKYRANKKKRILVVGYKSPSGGGMEAMTDLVISSDFLKTEFDLIILILRITDLNNRGKLGLRNGYISAYNLGRYLYFIFKYRPDLIHTHLSQNKVGFLRDSFFILCSRICSIRNCIHFHGSAFREFYETQPNSFKRYVKFVLKRIDRLIVLGVTLKEHFRGLVDEKKITHIYNAVKTEDYAIQKSQVRNGDNLRVTFIGYISVAKGALEVVKAAQLVISQNKNRINFDLFGPVIDIERNITFIEDPNNALLKIRNEINQNKLNELVKIHPPLDLRSKAEVLADSDIFVFPSYSEGCALVVLEAMAAGLPIVMTRVGSLPELLKDGINCLFIEVGDYAGLAEKILLLSRDATLRKRMGEANLNLVRSFFNSGRFENDIANIWRKDCLKKI